MTLSRRLTISTGLLIAAVVAVAVAGLIGVNSQNRDLTAALDEYERMRRCYAVGVHAWRGSQALAQSPPDRSVALSEVIAARAELDGAEDDPAFRVWYGTLSQVASVLADDATADDALLTAKERVNTVVSGVASESAATRRAIRDIEQRADAHRRWVKTSLAVVAVIASAMAIGVAVVLYRRVMGPVRRIASGVERVSRGVFDPPLEQRGDTELATLSRDFNHMAGQLASLVSDLETRVREQSTELARSERLASVGHLAAGVAHEINNPLGIIAAHTELALRGLPDSEPTQHETLTTIRDEAFRCKAITDRLLTLSRGGATREPTDLEALAEDVTKHAAVLPAAEGRTLSLQPAGPLETSAITDPALVRQVLLNLLVNALQATPDDGKVDITFHQPDDEPDTIALSITDSGKGMDPDTLARVFEPFFTTKRGSPQNAGTGLGLSISHAITEQLGGRLTASSPGEGRGSTFTLRLPRAT